MIVYCSECEGEIALETVSGLSDRVNSLLAAGYEEVEFFCATCSDTGAIKLMPFVVEKQ